MVGYTKGPWETDNIAVHSEGPSGRQICLCEITVRGRNYDETYDEALANARLIAAAPDLLSCLKLLDARGFTQATWHLCEQAIAKAEGRS